MTKGIQSKEDYYYRRVFTDAALAIDAVRQLPQLDSSRIAVFGRSQGGGIAIAVSARAAGSSTRSGRSRSSRRRLLRRVER